MEADEQPGSIFPWVLSVPRISSYMYSRLKSGCFQCVTKYLFTFSPFFLKVLSPLFSNRLYRWLRMSQESVIGDIFNNISERRNI